ncbi:DNA polymerase IV [Candidatus Hydrogenedentota bacterium]
MANIQVGNNANHENARILHVDMDAFFASVEQARNPGLHGKPVIVGGRPDRRGVVCAASYEARGYGIHSGMPLARAKRLCPNAVFLNGDTRLYQQASSEIAKILRTVSPVVEPLSLDEAAVDISGSMLLFDTETAIARYLRREIRRQTDLPASVGIGSNKLISKIACSEAKPDGYLDIAPYEGRNFLHPLPVCKLPGVGRHTRELLDDLGVTTIGRFAETPAEAVAKVLGSHGLVLRNRARGIDSSRVKPKSMPKSISRETTFIEDTSDWSHVRAVIMYLLERAAFALRESGLETRCIGLKVRYSGFDTKLFQRILPCPTDIEADLLTELTPLIIRAKEKRERVRLVGVALSKLAHNQRQLYLFGHEKSVKWENFMQQVDMVRREYDFSFLRTAKSMTLGRDHRLKTPSLSL